MRPAFCAPLVLALLLGGPEAATIEPAELVYSCDELVVIGRVKMTGETQLSGGSPLGQSRYDMRVRIKRVLRGKAPGRVVSAGGVSHARMREDADFWIILRPMSEGQYFIRAAGLATDRPRLAAECN